MNNKNILRRSYQKKFDAIKKVIIEKPTQGWIKTIREIFGMTTTQLAQRIGVSQPRIINMEKNENNIKISTMEKIADSLNCNFFYTFIPRENIEDIINNQARMKALKIVNKVNSNMKLENQLADTEELLKDLIKELLDGNIARIWDKEV